MKFILCFGDSNTWGYMPSGEGRYPYEKRWTTILQKELGADYIVIPEGLNGRTTVFEDPVMGNRSGIQHLPVILETHKPLDLVIILLGTNDLKSRFYLSAGEIADSAGRLIDYVLRSDCGPDGRAPLVLLIAPPKIVESAPFGYQFREDSIEKSKFLGEEYKRVSEEYGVYFLDADKIVKSSEIDGIHLNEDEHRKLGITVAEKVKEIFKQ